MTIVVSISSRSRLELTAWPTSPSAFSSSTERASSRPRCWSSWKSWTFWIAIAPCAANVLARLDRLLVERVDLVAPERDDAEDALVHQHRDAEQRADAAEVACPVPLVVGISEHVRDLDGAALEADAADDRARILRDRAVLDLGAVRVGAPEQVGQAIDVAVALVDHSRVGAAEPDRVAHDGLEHRLKLELPAPDDVEDLAGGRLLLDRLGQVPRDLRDAGVDGRSGFLLGGHETSRWR